MILILLSNRYNNSASLETRHNVSLYMGMPFLVSSFMIPLFGYLVDKYGRRAHLLLLSTGLGLSTFVLFMFTSPSLPLIVLGLQQ